MRKKAKFGLHQIRNDHTKESEYVVLTQFVGLVMILPEDIDGNDPVVYDVDVETCPAVLFHTYGLPSTTRCMAMDEFMRLYKFVTKHMISNHVVKEQAFKNGRVIPYSKFDQSVIDMTIKL